MKSLEIEFPDDLDLVLDASEGQQDLLSDLFDPLVPQAVVDEWAQGERGLARWRIFEKNRTELPVVFWHILEDETYQYGHQSLGKRLKRLIMDPIENGFDTRKEQWLVRVTL